MLMLGLGSEFQGKTVIQITKYGVVLSDKSFVSQVEVEKVLYANQT